MRALKELLELLLSEWEKLDADGNICMSHRGLCGLIFKLEHTEVITMEEAIILERFIFSKLEDGSVFLFPARLHRQRVEWLQKRIKELP